MDAVGVVNLVVGWPFLALYASSLVQWSLLAFVNLPPEHYFVYH